MNTPEVNQYPPAAERTLKVLDLFIADDKPKSVKEISNNLTIPIASIYRIIRCLVDNGFLQELPGQPDRYQLGYKIGILAQSLNNSLSIVAAPLMEAISLETNQACQLSILSHDAVITIRQTLPSATITVIASIGGKIPVNVSAAGKALTAAMPIAEQQTFLRSAWPLRTKNTVYAIDDLDAFVKALPNIAKNGYALDKEEYALGIGCLAVPVFDKAGKPIAAIGLTGHIDNYLDPQIVQKSVQLLHAASQNITEAL